MIMSVQKKIDHLPSYCSLGRGDIVKCFHCGTTLKDWQQEDDPVSVHKQNSPVCPVVIAKYKVHLYIFDFWYKKLHRKQISNVLQWI